MPTLTLDDLAFVGSGLSRPECVVATRRGDLFASQVTVRVVAGTGAGASVARIVSGDGYDPDTGAVMVAANEQRVLTFQVTENLDADTEVELQVFDARTGQRLGSSSASVAAPVVVEDRLD